MADQQTTVLVAGCGYVGQRVARAERQRGEGVAAMASSASSVADLEAKGIASFAFDLDANGGELGEAMPQVDYPKLGVYWFVPPPSQGVSDTRMENFLTQMVEHPPARIVAISTSGVYGDCQGRWIDEDELPKPQVDRARRRLDMERQLFAFAKQHGIEAVVLRVPGIYGPGRLPLGRIEKAAPVLRPQQSAWSNRVYVDDLVGACLAAADRGRNGAVYNVADGRPSTMTDYFHRVADAAGFPRCPEIDWDQAKATMSEAMLSYLRESKRLEISKMRDELGFTPRWTNLDEALKQALAQRL